LVGRDDSRTFLLGTPTFEPVFSAKTCGGWEKFYAPGFSGNWSFRTTYDCYCGIFLFQTAMVYVRVFELWQSAISTFVC